MVIKFSEEELNALEKKALEPSKRVICPRCGKELIFKEFGKSYQVKCPTEGCIIENCRGI